MTDYMTDADVLAMLQRACDAAGSRAAWARAHNVSAPFVSDVLLGKRYPSRKICDGLGLRRVMLFERAE